MTDFRSLCAELVDELHAYKIANSQHEDSLLVRARAALAKSSAGPSDEGLAEMYFGNSWFNEGATLREFMRIARAVLARFGAAQPRPVPVSERLPGPEDCDAEGKCWLFSKVEKEWRLIDAGNPGVPHLKYCFSHWLHAHALPLPEVTK